jgi:hypothetical protein
MHTPVYYFPLTLFFSSRVPVSIYWPTGVFISATPCKSVTFGRYLELRDGCAGVAHSIYWEGYGMGDRDSIPGSGRDFSLDHLVRTGSAAHLPSYPLDTGVISPGIKRAGRGTTHFHLMLRLRIRHEYVMKDASFTQSNTIPWRRTGENRHNSTNS